MVDEVEGQTWSDFGVMTAFALSECFHCTTPIVNFIG